jgi:signal peptidase
MEEQEDSEIADSDEVETTEVSSPEEEEVEESDEERPEPPPRRNWVKSTLLVLRDVAIALLVVFLVFMALWAYSGVWPPIVVVESSSMQHDDFVSSVGVIDTGDLVIVQNTNLYTEIETYVQSQCSGHATYGDEGDVIIYNERGGGDKPIIHRALIWLEFNTTTNDSFNAPGLECDKWVHGVNWWGQNAGGPASEPNNLIMSLVLRLTSAHRNFNITINLSNLLTEIKADPDWTNGGFIAMGDNNDHPDGSLIKHEWIIGKARGELPWFGLIKLSVGGDIPWGKVCSASSERGCASGDSWNSLIIALVVLIVVPIALDIGLGFYQRHRAKKASREDAEEEEEDEDSEDEEEEEEAEPDESDEETMEEDSEDSQPEGTEESLQT